MRGAPAEVSARERGERGAPAEVAARDREGRETPESEGRHEEDEKFFGPMGREGKKFWGNKRAERDDWLGGNSEGRRTCEDEGRMTYEDKLGIQRFGMVVERPWEGRTQREKSR